MKEAEVLKSVRIKGNTGKRRALLMTFLVIFFFPHIILGQRIDDPSFPVAPGAKPEIVSSQFSFTEGPASDAQGNVFFTDQPNDRIWKYDVRGRLSVFKEKAGRANGMFFDTKGNLIVCADEQNQLWSVSPNGNVKVLVDKYMGHLLNGPNDTWVSRSGDIYFTDPYYQRSYWERAHPDLTYQGVYLLKKGSKKIVCIEDSLTKPNGIVGTPDGKCLYVADIGSGKTYRYSIDRNGKLKNKTLFIEEGSDGMTIDNKGNLYLSGDGVSVYNSKGTKIQHIPIAAKWTANVCFGGPNKEWLFITASEHLYKLKMQVRGAK